MAKNKKKKNKAQENQCAKPLDNEKAPKLSKNQAKKEERLKKAKKRKQKRLIIAASILLLIVILTVSIVLIVEECNKVPKTEDLEFAAVEIENYGTITVQLDKKNAPMTASHFKKLAKEGRYKGLEFTGIKDGCLYTDTSKDWGKIYGEFEAYNNWSNNLSHTQGVLSMYRENDPNSGNGTFFITLEDKSEELDRYNAAFAKIVLGYEVIEQIVKDANEQGESFVYPKIGEIEIYTVTNVIE